MGPQEDYIETVFTCEGDINDPNLQSRLEDFQSQLKELLSTDKRKLILKKVEPWNSVRVTFNIPREAAWRLKQLAQQGNVTLRQLGVLAVQIEGDQLISLTIAGRNNARTQLIFRTADDTVDAPNLSLLDSGGGAHDYGSPGPTNVQSTRRNIADYLRQGASIFDSILTPESESAQNTVHVGRNPNIIGGANFHTDKNIQNVASHTASSSKAQGPSYSHFPAEIEQNAVGMDKPPPPYPEGSAWVNNIARGIRGIPPTTSPLLVNLLQTDPAFALAGMNNFMNSKMIPPPPESSPPLKKKRKPRKPKAGCEGEATIQSVSNPVLSSYSMPTSGSGNNILPVPMVTQALAANTQPSVTFSKSVPSTSEMMFSSVNDDRANYPEVVSSKALIMSSTGTEPILPESTVGKIINPYTGHLEPMEHSDSNPAKNCVTFDRLSPLGLNSREQTLLSKERMNHIISHNKLPSTCNSNMPASSTYCSVPLQQCQTNSALTVGSRIQGSESLSVTVSARSSSLALSSSQNYNLVQSSPIASVSKRSNILLDMSGKSNFPSQTCSMSISSNKDLYKTAALHGHHITVSSGSRTSTAESTYSSHKHLSNKDHMKFITSENLLNPLKNPAKKTGSCSNSSTGVNTEHSSHTKSIHDTHMQNDIGAVTTGCTTEINSKVYYNDSGVGSSSERSDDTPSEPGESDFKSANNHNHVEEFSKSVFNENIVQKQNLLNKPDQQVITVGYAMSNQQQNEKYSNDVSNILAIDKALRHPALKKKNSDLTKNNDLTDHQVAMMHLFSKNKKKSPKHFLHEDVLTKEHLQLLQKVDSMQYLQDNFHPHGKQDKSNQHLLSNSRLAVPSRIDNLHSPTSIQTSARTPSPRLFANHDPKETSDINMCNKTRHNVDKTPVSEMESMQNDIISSYLTQKNNERKAKSPISGNLTVSAAMELISLENMMSVNSAIGKHAEGMNAQGILKNDLMNNIKRPENILGSSENDVTKLSKSGSYKRRSPASALLNPLPQQFFDPKKLTESVQKLVKPLLPESSTLPHSQRRSPGSVGSRACTSPQSLKSDGLKDSMDSSDNVINGPMESDLTLNNDNHIVNSDILSNSSSDPLKTEAENGVKNSLNSPIFNHVLSEKTPKSNDAHDSDKNGDCRSDTRNLGSGNHSLPSQESAPSSVSAVSNIYNQSNKSGSDSSFKYSSEQNIQENHKQNASDHVKVPIEVSVMDSTSLDTTVTTSKIDLSKVPTNNNGSGINTINPENDKLLDKSVKNKNLNKKSDSSCNTGVEYSSLKVNCDSEKTSPKSSQKSTSVSPVKKGKSDEKGPIKLHLSHGIITNSQPFSKEELANETNITVITRSDHRKSENSAGEPTVPPLVLKVSRKPAVVEPTTEQKQEESQSLTMSLRARKASDASESTHNLRPPKPVRQKSVEQEVEQYKIVDDSSSKSLRQSRRRKTTSDSEPAQDSDKRLHIENCSEETDEKLGKSEEMQTEIGEGLTLFDTVKSGLRARTQNKPEEKIKVSPKELKQSKSVEEDNVKRNIQNRKSRQSPTTIDKQQTKEAREKSPGRIVRTRSGQISPSAEDDNSKRSTRSAKPKIQSVDTQNDATDLPPPPPSKRRRTTSRDHR
ncbi:unnamed protein product [Mytilus edulis]|uniref:Nuclear receptor coactivator 6 TRADD-N domain-containing protein n=1 Tax=Mytilus edulis TaxID=6550 RepID=A0A8S3V2M1_MYTED|nr:unnamed protein product [Mytilus edulis]